MLHEMIEDEEFLIGILANQQPYIIEEEIAIHNIKIWIKGFKKIYVINKKQNVGKPSASQRL